MNMQAMLKQAQKLQKDMLKEQNEIQNKEFVGKSSLVTIVAMGNKKIKSVKIDAEELLKDDIEMLEDMIMVALNDCINQIDNETENKLGKYTQGMPGIF